jgi:4-amino-4-deoxy-L-arabinose transferase-like glycosyltransferase
MRSEKFLKWWPLVVAVAMPPVTNLVCGIPRLALGNFTDSVFYLSYARQFSELVLRHGFLYYATRFGGIFPDAISAHLFGEIDGIWILRWILSALVSLSLFLAFRRRYGVLAGLLASALWSFNPAALRLSCTTYVDSTSVPFLILGCCLVLIAPSNAFCLFLAGILFGLASSAHLYAAFALALLIPFLVGAFCGREWKGVVRSISWLVAGFAMAWFLGWLWYTVVWGMPGLFSPTIDVLRDLGNGQAAQWKKPTPLALHETPAWFAPVVLLPVCLLCSWRGNSLFRGATFSLLLSTGFFWGGDLFGKAYVLSMPFYYSFLLPVTILASAAVCGELVSHQLSRSARMLVAGLLTSASVLPVVMARWEIDGWIPATVLLGSAAVLVLIWKRISLNWLVLTGAGLIFMASLSVSRTGMFSQMLGHYAAKDEPVLEISSRLREVVPGAWSDQGVTRFWYDDDPGKLGGSDRRMIGSFWLHYFGKFTGKNGNYIPFGEMDDANAKAIADNGPDRIVIFDQDPQKVADAVSVFSAKGLPYVITLEDKLVASSDAQRGLQVAILERLHPSSERTPSAKVSWHQMHRGRVLSSATGRTEFLSSRIKWWDPLAEADLGSLRKGCRIEIPYMVRSGRIRFSLGERGKEPMVTAEKWPSDNEAKLELAVPIDIKDAVISLRNRYPTGSVSQIQVGDAAIFQNRENQ